ncbi:MAG TPA: hypothetical protein VFA12_02930 [Stellaceae bacterium]|nr:hypothetical protein [Stellaceae bacterium]
MRHATWLKMETSPFWHGLYCNYRRLPDSVRAPVRTLLQPRWYIANYAIRKASRRRVLAGPFRGMTLNLSPLSQRYMVGYILGTMELELHGVLDRIIARGYRSIVNVGAADGFYAVGLALRMPTARVEAFEMQSALHPVIMQTARTNGVADRITIRGLCGPSELREALRETPAPRLVLMDAEGAERDLLDPERVPELAGADVLAESHDVFVPGITETLIQRFQASHDIERYSSRPRVLSDFPENFLPALPRLCPGLALDLMDERRAGVQQWLYLGAKQ